MTSTTTRGGDGSNGAAEQAAETRRGRRPRWSGSLAAGTTAASACSIGAKAGEQLRVEADGGMRCDTLAARGMSRSGVTAPGNGAQAACSGSTAATGKEAAPTDVLADEGRNLTGGKFAGFSLSVCALGRAC